MSKNGKLIMVTAGNTRVPIDKVRGIDNVFKGKTGARIAEYFADSGNEVILLASHPELVRPRLGLEIVRFRTFDDLLDMMRDYVIQKPIDIIVHSAAVSDYEVEGVYYKEDGSLVMKKINNSGKVSSSHQELWLRMKPTPKIIDFIRRDWNFRGVLVKFKLQVNMSDEELIKVARKSMRQSEADFIVANTLEDIYQKAFIISDRNTDIVETNRENLPARLAEALDL